VGCGASCCAAYDAGLAGKEVPSSWPRYSVIPGITSSVTAQYNMAWKALPEAYDGVLEKQDDACACFEGDG